MGWYKQHSSFKTYNDQKLFGKCIFCNHTKEIKRQDFVLEFSEFERQKGNICKDCYVANAVKVVAGYGLLGNRLIGYGQLPSS